MAKVLLLLPHGNSRFMNIKFKTPLFITYSEKEILEIIGVLNPNNKAQGIDKILKLQNIH